MKGSGQHLTLPLCLILALAVSGCVQTTTANLAKPAGPAAGNPFVLSSAGGGTAPPPPSGEPAPAGGSAAPATALADEPQPKAPAAAPEKKEPPATTETEPLPVAATAATTADVAPATTNSYPNINTTPQQPAGTLLPPDERKRIISELEKLRDGQSNTVPKSNEPATTLSKEAATHGEEALKQIEKCSQEGADKKYPECAPPKAADTAPAKPADAATAKAADQAPADQTPAK